MSTRACPDHEELASYVRGGASWALMQEIEAHLDAACPACESALRELEARQGSLAGLLRQHPPSFLRGAAPAVALPPVSDGTAPSPPDQDDSAVATLQDVTVTYQSAAPADEPAVPGRAGETLENAAREASSDAGAQRVGEYQVFGELGRGGMGVVYRAVHRTLKRTVALKMILAASHAAPEQVARFRLEAEAIARLKHPHIVQIFEIGEHAGNPYFALEFVDGGSLDRFRGTPQPPRLAAELVAVLARAMHAAHQAGVVHRDLKPANVLLALKASERDSASPGADLPLSAFEPKITDFGLAKQLDASQELSHSGAIMGTPSYMAPEQAAGRLRDIGPVTDVYALAAVLYDLLTGRPPFKGATAFETLTLVGKQEPVPPSRLQPKVPRDLETICLKGLRKEPRQRYGSAWELAEDLRRFLDGQPIRARPVSALERAWKWARREPARAAAAMCVVLALLGGAAGLVFYFRYQEQQASYREQQALARTDKLKLQVAAGEESDRELGQGEAAERQNEWDAARRHYERGLRLLERDPELAASERQVRLEKALERVTRNRQDQFDATQKQVKEQELSNEFINRVRRFGPERDRVIFHAVGPRDADDAGETVVRAAAPTALAALGLDVTKRPEEFAEGLQRFRPVVRTSELNRVAAECYLVLLAWAAAEVPSGPAADDDDGSARRALRLLDAAAALAAAHDMAAPQVYHLRRARCLELLGSQNEAEAEQRRAVGTPATAAIDRVESALRHYRKGEYRQAEAECERVSPTDPNRFCAQYLAALCALREERWDLAVGRLDGCLERSPLSPRLLMHRAVAHEGAKNHRAAEDDFAEALARASDNAAFRAVVLTNRSLVWTQRHEWDRAAADLRDAIALQPRLYQSHVNLAWVYQNQGKFDAAVRAMDEAVKLRPGDAPLYAARARLQLQRRDTAAARRDFEEFLRREPRGTVQWSAALVDLAALKLRAGDNEAALADCDAVLGERRNLTQAHLLRAEVLVRLQNYAEAGRALDCYRASGGPPTPAVYRTRGLIYTRFGQHAQAVDAFNRALALREDADTLSLRGWAFVAQNAAGPALADFDRALDGEPANVIALRGKATALVMVGRVAEAEPVAEAALRVGPRTAEALFQVACIYGLAAGSRGADLSLLRYQERSLDLLREAVELVPDQAGRRAFWQKWVEKSDKLLTLRGSGRMQEMQRLYGPSEPRTK